MDNIIYDIEGGEMGVPVTNVTGLRIRQPRIVSEAPEPAKKLTPQNEIEAAEPYIKIIDQAFSRKDTGTSIYEKYDSFTESKKWKKVRRYFDPKIISGGFIVIIFFYFLHDFTIMQNAELYSQQTQCEMPLVLLKDSVLEHNKGVPLVPIQDPSIVSTAVRISSCYLSRYSKNLSCITPVAYGMDMQMISIRNKSGDIIHLVNPVMEKESENVYYVPETNTLLANLPAANVSRPIWVYITYWDIITGTEKKEKFVAKDSFCISSSIDLFRHALPQTKGYSKEKGGE